MSKPKKKTKTSDSAIGGPLDRKRAIAAGSLVVAVVGTLIVAAVLQTRTEDEYPAELPEPAPIEIGETGLDSLPVDNGLPSGESPPAEPRPTEPPPRRAAIVSPSPSGDSVARRASADLRRLEAPGADWTLQFASMCDPDHVRPLAASLEGEERFYLVPAGDCYKIWWGRFSTREQAISAGGIPASLSALQDSPFPRRIAEALP